MTGRRASNSKMREGYGDDNGFNSRRQVSKNRDEYISPSGQEWVPTYYKQNKLGLRTIYIRGHCAKNGRSSGMKITETQKQRDWGLYHFLSRRGQPRKYLLTKMNGYMGKNGGVGLHD